MQWVTVYQAFNSAAAQLVRARLAAAGFHPVVAHELSALSLEGYAVAAGGILAQVPDAKAADAREYLAAPASESNESEQT